MRLAPVNLSTCALANIAGPCLAFGIAGNAVSGYFGKKGEICGLVCTTCRLGKRNVRLGSIWRSGSARRGWRRGT